jgi:histidinol-phosphate aminotransferase
MDRRTFFRSSAFASSALIIPEPVFGWSQAAAALKKHHWTRGNDILLNSNENAFGAFPSVKLAMRDAIDISNRYPDYEFDALYSAIAKHHSVRPENVVIGCGSTDILRMAAEAFCNRANLLVQAAPTFEALGMYAKRRSTNVFAVPLRGDYSHDLDAMLAKIKSENADLVYICNPNNPTGSITPTAQIESFIQELPQNTHVLIDEAYHHFATEAAGYAPLAGKHLDDPRVIIARTFSKIYGLAGMRVGYALAHPQTVEQMANFIVFDNPNTLAARAAVAALDDTAATSAAQKRFVDERAEFTRNLEQRKLKYIPSHANFVMFDAARPIHTVIDHFKQSGILIGRPFPPYETFARISLGLPQEMSAFWRAWDKLSA